MLEELRQTVHDIGEESVPILTELQDTVRATNGEIGEARQVTEEVAVLSKNAASLSENAAQVSGLLTHAVGTPIIKVASLATASRPASPAATAVRPSWSREG